MNILNPQAELWSSLGSSFEGVNPNIVFSLSINSTPAVADKDAMVEMAVADANNKMMVKDEEEEEEPKVDIDIENEQLFPLPKGPSQPFSTSQCETKTSLWWFKSQIGWIMCWLCILDKKYVKL